MRGVRLLHFQSLPSFLLYRSTIDLVSWNVGRLVVFRGETVRKQQQKGVVVEKVKSRSAGRAGSLQFRFKPGFESTLCRALLLFSPPYLCHLSKSDL